MTKENVEDFFSAPSTAKITSARPQSWVPMKTSDLGIPGGVHIASAWAGNLIYDQPSVGIKITTKKLIGEGWPF